MNLFDDELNRRLATLREQHLFRDLRRVDSAQGPRVTIGGKSLLTFSSNDYLWLANHPALKEPAIKAVEELATVSGASRLIITESIFSMDGDAAPLQEIVVLKEKYGAWLMVDEAHATGIIGQGGRGLADKLGIGSRIEIQFGTLGKALGASGGYICGSRTLIDYLVNRARSFIFSTAPVPSAAATAAAGIQLAQS